MDTKYLTIKEDQLKSCPCCGHKAVLEPSIVRKGFECTIQSTHCLLTMSTITYDTLEEAITQCAEDWNRRISTFN